MVCDEMRADVEAIAAGDVTPDAAAAAHVASCGSCRAALAGAEEIERMLHQRPAPAAPPQFTSRTLARVRREQWRREQFVDAGFNAAIVTLVLAVVVALWLAIEQTGMVTLSGDVVDTIYLVARTVIRRAAPVVPLYAGATAIVMGAVGLWWWAEHETRIW